MPVVTVIFRALKNDVPGGYFRAQLPLSSLPHYRKGTIWRKGQCISDTEAEEERFNVNFSPAGWSLTSRAELCAEGNSHIFPDREYPLLWRDRDKCRLINFKLADEKNLLIPCTEYFVRAYARNMEICRALATLRWSDVMSAFYDPPLRSELRWQVNPSGIMRFYDAIFLGHLLYEDYTEMRVKHINSQFISSSPGKEIFLDVAPWFEGPGELLCRGRWINQGRTFICLDLIGSSEPLGQQIEWQRKQVDTSSGVDGGNMLLPRPITTLAAEEFLAEASNIEPDRHAEIKIVKARTFKRLGQKRSVIKIKRAVQANRGRMGPKPPKAETHSSGTGTGSGKNTGKIEHISEIELESRGFLRDIWNAFKTIQAANLERVSELSWYTPNHGFRNQSDPQVILIPPADDHPDSKVRAWVYLDKETYLRRGLMVLKMKIDGVDYLCLEIQRKEAEEGGTIKGHAGLLMKSSMCAQEEITEFVEDVCSRIRYAIGSFKNIRSTFPEQTKIFNHMQKDQKILYRKTLINAFEELGVELI
ncbi:hypothetical protein A9179_21420 [Pseudomonas alcaligenes]|uniref:Transposase n=1 Tax=Aquipseudomonas alcaligenes TaxID=43263 RepID=A0ABR7S5R7_AQUAC|nr:hypothetical protein [Pseudomonas alcaligenes]